MTRHLQILPFAIVALALLTGCPKKPTGPNPEDTVIGPGDERVDYVITTDVYGEEDPLYKRPDEDFTSEANQIRDLFPPVYFDYDQAAIRPDQRSAVEQAAQHLIDNPSQRLLIEGHCDWRGTVEYNLALGDRRASAVRLYLSTLGIDMDRMEINSKGKLEAIVEGTEDQMARDRRADLVVVR